MAYTATGGTATTAIVSTAKAATAIATDPALPEVVSLVLKLQSLEKSESARAGGSTGQGIGLRNVVGPLRAFVKIQEKPWILPVTVIGAVGAVFAAGYFLGKMNRG